MRLVMNYYLKCLKLPSQYEVGSFKHYLFIEEVADDFGLH
ncbi:hypothetical protein B4147_3247 [Bacillus wiedmannii]|uniref:Uncharacterized protein n=1 Tax=Bacillus wiedmannii TaxID=1890302 RepID=A0A0G8C6I4_9BACI|nr:hypothetical protein B4147_3247 [Bacillus wiedmannii]